MLARFETELPPSAAGVWKQSVATDVNDDNVIVGWAQPNTDMLSSLPTECGVDDGTTLYLPADAVAPGASETTSFVCGAAGRVQMLIDRSELGPMFRNLSSVALRSSVAGGLASCGGVTVKVGYAAQEFLQPNMNANFASTPTEVFAGDWSWNTDLLTSDPNAFDAVLRFTTPFYYQPADRSLVIEFTSTGPYTGPGTGFTPQAPVAGAGPLVYNASQQGNTGTTAKRPYLMLGFDSQQYLATQPEPAIVWKQTGSTWAAACLPMPSQTHFGMKANETPALPKNSNVFINNAGLIAGTVGVQHEALTTTQATTAKFFGTPTLWCQLSSGPLRYEGQALKDGESGSMPPISAVTGLGSKGDVIGVSKVDANDGTGRTRSRASVWLARYSGSTCPGWFNRFDLTTPLAEVLSYLTVRSRSCRSRLATTASSLASSATCSCLGASSCGTRTRTGPAQPPATARSS